MLNCGKRMTYIETPVHCAAEQEHCADDGTDDAVDDEQPCGRPDPCLLVLRMC